jgi:dTDP-4-dehydrorhamnose 3,5-epimerase
MKFTPTAIPDVIVVEPKVFGDARGFFMESWNERVFSEAGITARFVQDNHSRSVKGVLRGLHYQIKQPQGKLIRVIHGEIFDAVVDIRRKSPSFGKIFTTTLSGNDHKMLWVPPGFAHGFCVTSESAEVLYKSSDFYAPQHERTILWNDPELSIAWPVSGIPTISAKDAAGIPLRKADIFE